MKIKNNIFEIPNKEIRLKAIGDIDNLPEGSLKKILSTAENFHNPIYAPEEDDWLFSQKEEGQTFNQFLNDSKDILSKERNIIYINPLQEMPQEFLDNIILYCQSFFYPWKVELIKLDSLQNLKVKYRFNQYTNKIQYHSGKINSKMKKYETKYYHC